MPTTARLLPLLCTLSGALATLANPGWAQDLTPEVQAASQQAAAADQAFQQLLSEAEAAGPGLSTAKADYMTERLALEQRVAQLNEQAAEPAAGKDPTASPATSSAQPTSPTAAGDLEQAAHDLVQAANQRISALIAASPTLSKAMQWAGAQHAPIPSQALAALDQAMHSWNAIDDQLTATKQEQAQLGARIADLTPRVAAQKDAEKKARNQRILDLAQAQLDTLTGQLAELIASEKETLQAIADMTGSAADDALASARALLAQWHHARRLFADIQALGEGLAGIQSTPRVRIYGMVTRTDGHGVSSPLPPGNGIEIALPPNCTLTTGPASSAELELWDGTHVTLGAGSNLHISIEDGKPVLDLGRGTLRIHERFGAKVERIHLASAVAAVRGTDALCSQDADRAVIRVQSGSIDLSQNGVAPQVIAAGQRATIAGDGTVAVAADAPGYDAVVDALSP